MSTSDIILVPVDFQDPSLSALAAARELGVSLNLEVVLFHAYTVPLVAYPGLDPIMVPGLPEEIRSAATTALSRLAAANGGLRTVLAAGDAADEALRAIQAMRPVMVVMGTHGRTGLSRLLLGSVAEKIVRTSEAPVLTVHGGARLAFGAPGSARGGRAPGGEVAEGHVVVGASPAHAADPTATRLE
jgi:nucleotide-binding universal stress UspA family protein